MRFSEFSFYSPIKDCECVRLSVFDSHGQEFFMILERPEGKLWREERNRALDDIALAIKSGCRPGEVRVI